MASPWVLALPCRVLCDGPGNGILVGVFFLPVCVCDCGSVGIESVAVVVVVISGHVVVTHTRVVNNPLVCFVFVTGFVMDGSSSSTDVINVVILVSYPNSAVIICFPVGVISVSYVSVLLRFYDYDFQTNIRR